jgi:RNA polymerase sigma factor (sigma-70 family)
VTNVAQDIDALIVGLEAGLRMVALRRLGNGDEAREATQETLARLVERLRTGSCTPVGEIAPIAYGIARHVIADMLRRRHRVAELSPAMPARGEDVLDHLVREDDAARVRAGLERLNAADRELLRQCFVAGRRITDISAALGEPPERVRKRKSRALERLRRLLAAMAPGGHQSDLSAMDEE